jgi:hypothetical protein
MAAVDGVEGAAAGIRGGGAVEEQSSKAAK